MMVCDHKHGDTVNGFWLCGKCYEKLDERPRKYGVERLPSGDGDIGYGEAKARRTRQTVKYAEIKIADSDYTLSKFIMAMARKIQSHTVMDVMDANDYAIDLLRMLSVEFGCPDMDWGMSGAWEIVMEDIQYWDDDSGCNT